MQQQSFDYMYLSSITGLTAATILLTEFMKEIPGLRRIPTRLLAAINALIITLLTKFISNHFSFSNLILYILDSLLVATSAIGSWDSLISKRRKRYDEQ